MIETANEEMRLDKLARSQEEERLLSGEKFEFEPRFLPWCQRFTMAKLTRETLRAFADEGLIPEEWMRDLQDGASPLLKKVLNEILDGKKDAEAIREQFVKWKFDFVFDPARGDVRAVFALCDRLNADGNCVHFSPREPKDAV